MRRAAYSASITAAYLCWMGFRLSFIVGVSFVAASEPAREVEAATERLDLLDPGEPLIAAATPSAAAAPDERRAASAAAEPLDAVVQPAAAVSGSSVIGATLYSRRSPMQIAWPISGAPP